MCMYVTTCVCTCTCCTIVHKCAYMHVYFVLLQFVCICFFSNSVCVCAIFGAIYIKIVLSVLLFIVLHVYLLCAYLCV